jgi:hypothetical protein
VARTYADPPPPGPIELSLVGKTPLERMIIRAQELNKLQPGASFILDGIEVQLLAPIRMNDEGTGVQFRLRARVVTTGVFLPMDNPYRFLNPPVKIPNGTWRKVATDIGEVELENMEENPMAAMKRIVLDAVLTRARQLGWQG